MPVENTNTGFGQGSTGAHTNAVPSHSAMPSSVSSTPPGYTPQTWAFQQQVYKALDITPQSSNPSQAGYVAGLGSASHSNSSSSPATSPSAAQPSPTSTASPSKVSITESPPATGANQLPGWVAAELQSGKISSYTNSSTGQTWYAPGALGSEPEYQSIWLSGPGYSGPVQSSNGNLYINKGGTAIPVTTTQTTEISENGKALYNGPSTTAPWLSFGSNGKFEGTQNVLPTSAPPAPNTQLQPFTTPSGTVYLPDSMMVNGVMVTGTWTQDSNGGF